MPPLTVRWPAMPPRLSVSGVESAVIVASPAFTPKTGRSAASFSTLELGLQIVVSVHLKRGLIQVAEETPVVAYCDGWRRPARPVYAFDAHLSGQRAAHRQPGAALLAGLPRPGWPAACPPA